MFSWANFEAAAPILAAQGRELIEHFRFVLVGTIRRDGTPRISPVEVRLVCGHLMLVMIPGTLKARDLLRDPRILVNSPITHPDDPNSEFKLRGRVIEIQDPELRELTASAIEATSGWRPPDGWHFFARQHLVDAGYVTSANLVQSQSGYSVDLVGPTLKTHWYQAETGYDLTHFDIDWEAETVTCPQGRTSSSWTPVQDAGKALIKIKFSQSDCKVCPAQACCTGTTRRTLTLHPREQMLALLAARKREETGEFKDTYRHRAGIEGTHSQAVRSMGLRRSRYIGLRKTHLGHVAVAAAVNIIQLMSWLRGEAPEQTRTSPFKRVMKQAA